MVIAINLARFRCFFLSTTSITHTHSSLMNKQIWINHCNRRRTNDIKGKKRAYAITIYFWNSSDLYFLFLSSWTSLSSSMNSSFILSSVLVVRFFRVTPDIWNLQLYNYNITENVFFPTQFLACFFSFWSIINNIQKIVILEFFFVHVEIAMIFREKIQIQSIN